MGITCTKKDNIKEKLIDQEINYDTYYVDYIKEDNKIRTYVPVKLVFSDHLCIYNIYTKKLIIEISYYKINGWKHGQNLWGIIYNNSENKTLEVLFRVNDNYEICNSIKKKVNELLELNNRTHEKYEL